MMGALAEFERTLIRERTQAGLIEARLRGKRLGPSKALSSDQIVEARYALNQSNVSLKNLAEQLHVSVKMRDGTFGMSRFMTTHYIQGLRAWLQRIPVPYRTRNVT